MVEQRPRTERDEKPLERADRNFAELLQELRVTQTGVQILFAFLLTLAFTQRFPSLDTTQRATYVTTLLLAFLAAALFTAPAALHRSLFQQNVKPAIVRVSSWLTHVGLYVLMLAFTGSVLLVVDVTVGRGAGIAAGAGTLAVCLALWTALPWLVQRHVTSAEGRGEESDPAT
ncbi:DUF6328 family protein [Streptomyces sp. NBC_00038]|uniref:DUF6328 family protein n=1 Tax=Streptomyces sp. NBC_00038 TaxID=2903615 RepID=UPI00224F4F4C|nr:DUF6328 family protein [Streptomyces sp. NBC_00038]MCX5555909.1 DUF6328 family protein [Streptomyces sp. NBC_00038]